MRRDGPIQILLVEDNPADVRLTVEALRAAGVENHLQVAGDGVEALLVLRRQGVHAGAARPDLVLLDLNLPRKNGREVLAEVKRDPDLRRIPVVVLTTSAAEEDVAESYALHANCYVVKPVGFAPFAEAMRALQAFWLHVATLPTRPEPAGTRR
jgi:chemotaxis family two-component system response regulator Rcp1